MSVIKKILYWLNIVLFVTSLLFAIYVFLPDDVVPEGRWSRNLYRSQLICQFPGYCHYPKNQCILREKLSRDGSIKPVMECYNNHGNRGPNHPEYKKFLDTVRIEIYGTNVVSGLHLEEKDTIRAQLERILNDMATDMGLGLHFEVYNYAHPMLFVPSMFRKFIYAGINRRPDLAIFEYRGDLWFCPFDVYGRRALLRRSRFLQLFDHPGFRRRVLNRLLSLIGFEKCGMYELHLHSVARGVCKLGNRVIRLAKKYHTQLAFLDIVESGPPRPEMLLNCLKHPSAFAVWDPDFHGAAREKMWIRYEPDANGSFYLAWFMAHKILSGAVDMEYRLRP